MIRDTHLLKIPIKFGEIEVVSVRKPGDSEGLVCGKKNNKRSWAPEVNSKAQTVPSWKG